MKQFFCVTHNKSHTSEGGWRYTKWDTKDGIVLGWGCAHITYPEFTTRKIREDRLTYASDQLQSHRGGELSREFVEVYPNRIKQMVKDGAVSQEEVKKSKYVWQEVKGWEKSKKIDAESIS